MANNNNKRPGAFIPGLGSPLKPNNLSKQLADAKTDLKLRPSKASQIRPSNTNFVGPMEPKLDLRKEPQKDKRSKRTATKTANKMKDDKYVPPIFSDQSFSTSEDFISDLPQETRTGLYPDRRSGRIMFDYKDSMPLSVMQLEDNYNTVTFPTTLTTVRNTMKLSWNLASYARNFSLSPALSPYSTWAQHLTLVYARYSRDIISLIRSKIIDNWTEPKFKLYLQNITELLEFFYCVDSILSYEGSPESKDRNPVLLKMKSQYSDFGILLKHDEARRILKNCWLPDKFSAMIAWTYQNYKTGPADQAHNYRMFNSTALYEFHTTAFSAQGLIDRYKVLISNVTTTDNRDIISLLSQTYPKGKIGNLPLSCSESVYDQNHYEMYVNQGIFWPGNDQLSTSIGFPNAVGYNMYSSVLSAEEAGCFPFVLNSTFSTDLGDFTNGVLLPIQAKAKQDGTLFAVTDWKHSTNKFYAYNPNSGTDDYTVLPRNWNNFSVINPTLDTHVMNIDYNLVPSTGIKGCNSMSKGPFQNLYFNTDSSRIVVMREFLNDLFYLK